MQITKVLSWNMETEMIYKNTLNFKYKLHHSWN